MALNTQYPNYMTGYYNPDYRFGLSNQSNINAGLLGSVWEGLKNIVNLGGGGGGNTSVGTTVQPTHTTVEPQGTFGNLDPTRSGGSTVQVDATDVIDAGKEAAKRIGEVTGLTGGSSGDLEKMAGEYLDWQKNIYERDYAFRDPERQMQEDAWFDMMGFEPRATSVPGAFDPYQMLQSPNIQQFDPGLAPGYRQWNPDFTPQMFTPSAAPTQTPYGVNLGQGLGQYAVSQADPGGMYQRGTFDLEADQGYQFAKEAGLEALQRQAARRGGRDSGRTFKDEARFLSGLASQEADKAYGRFAQEEAAKQAAFESGAGRGLQAYGLQEPLAAQAFENMAQRGLQRDITGAQLGLGAYEGAMDRGMQGWQTGQQLGLQGMQDYQQNMMNLMGMGQAEQQFAGNLGLQSYLGQGGLQQQATSDYNKLMSDMYRTQLPFDFQSYQMQTEQPWKQFDATRMLDQDAWNRLLGMGGYQSPSTQGMQSGYDNMLQAIVGQNQARQGGLQNLLGIASLVAGFM